MVCSELHTKIGKREETVGVIDTLLVFTVAALYFAVVTGCVWADQFVPNSKACSGQFKACGQVSFAVGETVGKFEAIVSLHTLYPHAAAFESGRHFLQKIGGRIGALLRVGTQIAQSCILVDGGILV